MNRSYSLENGKIIEIFYFWVEKNAKLRLRVSWLFLQFLFLSFFCKFGLSFSCNVFSFHKMQPSFFSFNFSCVWIFLNASKNQFPKRKGICKVTFATTTLNVNMVMIFAHNNPHLWIQTTFIDRVRLFMSFWWNEEWKVFTRHLTLDMKHI